MDIFTKQNFLIKQDIFTKLFLCTTILNSKGNAFTHQRIIPMDIKEYIGQQIKNYRKSAGLTLQELADAIYKSRATVCKYENGTIPVDVETLYDISNVLHVPLSRLTDYHPETHVAVQKEFQNANPFFSTKRLYFYFYDGRSGRLKDGVIDIGDVPAENGCYEAHFRISSLSNTGPSGATYYIGRVLYSDILIRFSFVNQYNPLEEDLLYIFNPLEMRDFSDGLLCGISGTDFMPCAFRCLVTLSPQELGDNLRQRLLWSKKEIKQWEKLNMLLIGNRNDL